MGLISGVVAYSGKVIKLTGEVEQLRQETLRLADEQRDLDRRLIRIETLIEYAMQRRALPPGSSD